ncbi:hypothetical protein [Desulfobacter sp.]
MPATALKEKVSALEQMMMELAYESMKTDIALRDLSSEMKDFKDEMKDFKNEMKDFKDEMKDFKDEMKGFKNEMNKQWGDLANKMGTIVEDIVAPGLKGIGRRYFGLEEFDHFAIRVRIRNKDRSMIREFDVIAETNEYFFIVETKSTPRSDYITEFINLLPELPLWFPVLKEKKLIPIFASLHLPGELITYLTKNNIIAMANRDDGMDIYNTEVLEKLGL